MRETLWVTATFMYERRKQERGGRNGRKKIDIVWEDGSRRKVAPTISHKIDYHF